ncbi:UNVERIFIED_CONTAM: hypothetical protein FKN15_002956 [Acipenser sinensis]
MSITLKQVFNKDKTFRPKRKFEPGTQRFELHKKAQASLNSGVDIKAAVQLPHGEDLNDWVAVHVVDFFNRINLIYGTICEFCTEKSCPVMSGGPRYEYRWQDDLKYKKPTALPAPQYMNLLMDWIEVQINNEEIFPTSIVGIGTVRVTVYATVDASVSFYLAPVHGKGALRLPAKTWERCKISSTAGLKLEAEQALLCEECGDYGHSFEESPWMDPLFKEMVEECLRWKASQPPKTDLDTFLTYLEDQEEEREERLCPEASKGASAIPKARELEAAREGGVACPKAREGGAACPRARGAGAAILRAIRGGTAVLHAEEGGAAAVSGASERQLEAQLRGESMDGLPLQGDGGGMPPLEGLATAKDGSGHLPHGIPFPKNFIQICKKIVCRLFRVFVHVYIHHFDRIILMGAEAHVNTCYKHFYYFGTELNLIDRKELEPLRCGNPLRGIERVRGIDVENAAEASGIDLEEAKDKPCDATNNSNAWAHIHN